METVGNTAVKRPTAVVVQKRVERGGRRFWSLRDFEDLPSQAVLTALSRLNQRGVIERQGKGVYYRPTPTGFGLSRPSRTAAAAKQIKHVVHPAGLSAANLLGFTTQNVLRGEYATTATGTPTALRGSIVHTRRPQSRAKLSQEEGALLEVLRDRASTSDLSEAETVKRMLRLLTDRDRFKKLAIAAKGEPPRVRAMLGALGEQLDMPQSLTAPLRNSLNPASVYGFGKLSTLKYAHDWQAR